MTIGLIGAGHIGSQVARLAVKAGHDVVISNSRGPDTLADLVKELGPHARADTPDSSLSPGLEILRWRSARLAPIVANLRKSEQTGQLNSSFGELAVSHIHMGPPSRSCDARQLLSVFFG